MKPDKPKATYTLFQKETRNTPTIIFGTRALKWIEAMVQLHEQEIGWYACVDERPDYTYFVRDVFYPKHSEVHGATCEISPEGETEMIEWLCDHGRDADIEKVRLWGHSHHNMGTSPSKQDEDQAMERMTATKSFLIRAICNKQGEMSISFFDYENQLKFDHVKWKVEDDSTEEIESNKINQVANLLSDAEKSSRDKLKEVREIISRDDESEEIKNKILELKKENLPPEQTNFPGYKGEYSYNRRSGGVQTNIFKKEKNYRKGGGRTEGMDCPHSETDYQEELEFGFHRNVAPDDPWDKQEVSSMIENWENRVGLGP